MINRLSYRKIAFPGLALGTAALFLLTTIAPSTGQSFIWLCGALIGFGIGMMASVVTISAQFSVPRKDIGVATSMVFFFLFLGGTILSSVVGTIQTNSLSASLATLSQQAFLAGTPQSLLTLIANPNLVGQVLTNPALRTQIPDQIVSQLRNAVSKSIVATFWATLFVSLGATLISLGLSGSAKKQMEKSIPSVAEKQVSLPEHNSSQESSTVPI